MSTRDGAGGGDPQPVGFRSPGRARRQATPRLRGGGAAPGPQQPGPRRRRPLPGLRPLLGSSPAVSRPSRTLGTGRAGAASGFRPPGGIPGVGAREGDTWDNVPRTPRGSDTHTKGLGVYGGCSGAANRGHWTGLARGYRPHFIASGSSGSSSGSDTGSLVSLGCPESSGCSPTVPQGTGKSRGCSGVANSPGQTFLGQTSPCVLCSPGRGIRCQVF